MEEQWGTQWGQDPRGFTGYGGKRTGQRGRPPLRSWRDHTWWGKVEGAKSSNWSPNVCWVWTGECPGEFPYITIRKRRISVRRHLYQVVLPETEVGVEALDPDVILTANPESCSSMLCINPWHAVQVPRREYARQVATAWQSENQQPEVDWERYCAYVWEWHATGVQPARVPVKDDNVRFEMMQRFDREHPGIREQALQKSIALQRES